MAGDTDEIRLAMNLSGECNLLDFCLISTKIGSDGLLESPRHVTALRQTMLQFLGRSVLFRK